MEYYLAGKRSGALMVATQMPLAKAMLAGAAGSKGHRHEVSRIGTFWHREQRAAARGCGEQGTEDV